MGHKGVSKRKPPKAKSKKPATANHGGGLVSDLSQSASAAEQLPGKTKAIPAGRGRIKTSSRPKKRHKNH